MIWNRIFNLYENIKGKVLPAKGCCSFSCSLCIVFPSSSLQCLSLPHEWKRWTLMHGWNSLPCVWLFAFVLICLALSCLFQSGTKSPGAYLKPNSNPDTWSFEQGSSKRSHFLLFFFLNACRFCLKSFTCLSLSGTLNTNSVWNSDATACGPHVYKLTLHLHLSLKGNCCCFFCLLIRYNYWPQTFAGRTCLTKQFIKTCWIMLFWDVFPCLLLFIRLWRT